MDDVLKMTAMWKGEHAFMCGHVFVGGVCGKMSGWGEELCFGASKQKKHIMSRKIAARQVSLCDCRL